MSRTTTVVEIVDEQVKAYKAELATARRDLTLQAEYGRAMKAQRDALAAALRQLSHCAQTYSGNVIPQAVATALVAARDALALVQS